MSIAFWRDISIIWLSLLCFVALLLPLGISYFLFKGMNAVLNALPPYFRKAQDMSTLVRTQTESTSHKVADPIIRVQKKATQFDNALRSFWRANPRPDNAKKNDAWKNDIGKNDI